MTSPSTALPGMLAERVLKRQGQEVALETLSHERSDSLADYAARFSSGADAFRGRTRMIVCSDLEQSNATTWLSFAGTSPNQAFVGRCLSIGPCDPVSIYTYGQAGSITGTAAGFAWNPSIRGRELLTLHTTSHHGIDLASSVLPTIQMVDQFIGTQPRSIPLVHLGKDSAAQTFTWLHATQSELSEALQASESLDTSGVAELFQFADLFLSECAPLDVELPSVDLDHDGNIEFFWRQGNEGLLAVVRIDGSLHLFGSSNGESWRCSYMLAGRVWRNHMVVLLGPFRANANT